nr:molybdate ABC transporter substrate-binding protein [uncultured Desulfobacter sp.]
MKKIMATVISTFVFFAVSAFAQTPEKMIVYCGITMLKPMVEISKIFEKTHDCRVAFVKGGSGKLLNLLLKNKNGDLFLPGSDSYITKIDTEHKGLVTASAHVGFNKAALFVKKGNPKNLTSDLNNLLSKDYTVIIGSPEKGSIGKETKKILTKKGIYEDVKNRAVVTLHSQSLVNALKTDKADVTINWFAVSTWPENSNEVEALPIDDQYAKKKKLVLAVLKDSKNPDLATAFLNFASSEKGKAVFQKYGLGI